jgi:putative nucleotidyltransferase with HDIG domain
VEGGVALVYPAAAVAVAAGLLFRWWGVAGFFIGTALTPWGLADTPARALFFAAAASLQGAVPAVVARRVPARVPRSLWVLLWAVVLNTLLSALAGLAGLMAWSEPPLSQVQAISALVSWFFGDTVATMVLAIPVVLLLRRDLVLDQSNRALFERWLARPVGVVSAVAGVLAVVAIIETAAGAGFVRVHWIAAAFLVPVLWASVRGGVGGALLVNAVAGFAYVVEVVRLHPEIGRSGQFVELFSTYVNTTVFALGAVAVGLAWGKAESMVIDLEEHRRLLEKSFDRVVTALGAAIEAKDPTTEGHVQRVGDLAVAVGRRLGIAGQRLELLRYAALLHDVGKIGVPEHILNKKGALDAQEREVLERHVVIGVEILESVDILQPAIPFIRYHQERWDGCVDPEKVRYVGYFGKRGADIPLEARIIAAVDAWDAMTHDRPYRAAMERETAAGEMRRERGAQFDPRVVDVLLEVVDASGRGGGAAVAPVPAMDLSATPG